MRKWCDDVGQMPESGAHGLECHCVVDTGPMVESCGVVKRSTSFYIISGVSTSYLLPKDRYPQRVPTRSHGNQARTWALFAISSPLIQRKVFMDNRRRFIYLPVVAQISHDLRVMIAYECEERGIFHDMHTFLLADNQYVSSVWDVLGRQLGVDEFRLQIDGLSWVCTGREKGQPRLT
ncbi:unnamed protein product [Sphagnum balticum]